MTNARVATRRFFLAAAAFGLVSIGLAGAASANPATVVSVRAGIHVDAGVALRTRSTRDHRGEILHTPVVRRDNRFIPWTEAVRLRAMNRYDLNHNRRIDAAESRAFWSYVVDAGVYGRLSSDEVGRFAQLAYLFDTNRDGRMIGIEWRGMDKLIDSLRLFKTLDRNGDRYLTAREAGFSALAPRFRIMDVNRDRVVSQQEVRDDVLKMYRNGRL
jgi:hypothetical protein